VPFPFRAVSRRSFAPLAGNGPRDGLASCSSVPLECPAEEVVSGGIRTQPRLQVAGLAQQTTRRPRKSPLGWPEPPKLASGSGDERAIPRLTATYRDYVCRPERGSLNVGCASMPKQRTISSSGDGREPDSACGLPVYSSASPAFPFPRTRRRASPEVRGSRCGELASRRACILRRASAYHVP
jgi:hypothetical protein